MAGADMNIVVEASSADARARAVEEQMTDEERFSLVIGVMGQLEGFRGRSAAGPLWRPWPGPATTSGRHAPRPARAAPGGSARRPPCRPDSRPWVARAYQRYARFPGERGVG